MTQINYSNHITLVDFVNEAGLKKSLFDAKNFWYEKLENPTIRYYTFDTNQANSAKASAYLKDSEKTGFLTDIIRAKFDESLFALSKDDSKTFSQIKKLESDYIGEINRLKRSNFYRPWSKAYDNHPIQRYNMKAIEAVLALDVVLGFIPNEHSLWILGGIYLTVQGIKRSKIRRGNKKQLKSIEVPLRQYELLQENLLNASNNGSIEVKHFPEAEREVALFIEDCRKNFSNPYIRMDYDSLNDFIAHRYGLNKNLDDIFKR